MKGALYVKIMIIIEAAEVEISWLDPTLLILQCNELWL